MQTLIDAIFILMATISTNFTKGLKNTAIDHRSLFVRTEPRTDESPVIYLLAGEPPRAFRPAIPTRPAS